MTGSTRSSGNDLNVRGFQGSMTSTVEVRFYSLQRDHRKLGRADISQRSVLICDGANERSKNPSVTFVQTYNAHGTAGGAFQVVLKPGLTEPRDLRDAIVEDDWCDIIFYRHGSPYHAYRGQVDTVLRNRRIVSGATDISFTVTGRGFGKPFEVTPIWFDRFSEGDYVGFAASRVWNENNDFFNGPPNATVKSLLYGFLRQLGQTQRGVIQLPQLPGEPSQTFGDIRLSGGEIVSTQFIDTAFTNTPARRSAIFPPAFNPDASFLWPLAQAWADMPMCELYCELGPQQRFDVIEPSAAGDFGFEQDTALSGRNASNIYFPPETPVALGDARMYVYFRDRPFPTVSRADPDGRLRDDLNGANSPYFTTIPTYNIQPEAVFAEESARSGLERKNAFFVTPKLFQEMLGPSAVDIARPVIDLEDIEVHGLRRLDVGTRYSSFEDGTITGLIEQYRSVMRDFHSLNDTFLSGSVTIRPGRPDIKLGGRLRVFEEIHSSHDTNANRDPSGAGEFTTYYIESVTHSWRRPEGLTTQCQVSRGWRGSDESLVNALTTVTDSYTQPELFSPAPGSTVDGDEVSDPPDNPSLSHLETVPADADFATQQGGYFEPGSEAFVNLFTAAATQAGVPVTWARYKSLEKLVANESGGWVGIPNFTFGERSRQKHRWPDVWDELRSGQFTSNAVVLGGRRFERSSATGLGQLILSNVETFYPGANAEARRQGVGIALNEAVGMLRYIQSRYGNPNNAWRTWQQNKTVKGYHFY